MFRVEAKRKALKFLEKLTKGRRNKVKDVIAL